VGREVVWARLMLGLGLVAGELLPTLACTGSHLAGIAQSCAINSDCNSPLICVFTRCHNACRASVDCPTGQRCVPSGIGGDNVCQLPIDSVCAAAPCLGGAVCGADGQCRPPCTTSSGATCVTGQSCVKVADTSSCYDPNNVVDQAQVAMAKGSDAGNTATSVPSDGSADTPEGDARDNSSFIGAPWDATVTIQTICTTGNTSVTNTAPPSSLSVLLFASGSGIAWTAPNGCTFEFAVSGNTATLSNVTCANTPDASMGGWTYSTFTMNTPDGHNLTLSASGTQPPPTSGKPGTETCTFTMWGGAKR
jgi:hypothetical protein